MDSALPILVFGLLALCVLAFVEHLTKPRPADPEIDRLWFKSHEADVWRAIQRVSEDASKGRYQS